MLRARLGTVYYNMTKRHLRKTDCDPVAPADIAHTRAIWQLDRGVDFLVGADGAMVEPLPSFSQTTKNAKAVVPCTKEEPLEAHAECWPISSAIGLAFTKEHA
jgi:hypothetical protein